MNDNVLYQSLKPVSETQESHQEMNAQHKKVLTTKK